MDYRDFIIEFDSPEQGGHYPVRVVTSPCGTASGFVKLPFELHEIEDTLQKLCDGKLPHDSPWQPKGFGSKLFHALFQGDILQCFQNSLCATNEKLRIKLRMDINKKDLAQVHRIPWEFMVNSVKPLPLALQPNIALVRHVPIMHTHQAPRGLLPLPSPFRILAVTPNPDWDQIQPISVEAVENALRASVCDPDVIQIEFLKNATPQALKRKLEERHFHVLHITAHGRFCDEQNKGFILFEGDSSPYQGIDGNQLGAICNAASRSLRMVTLVSCDSAKMGHGENNPWGGVAPSLAATGIPAVLAMQFQISYERAFAFSTSIYERIARGEPIDTAINQTRVDLLLNDKKAGLEWGTPVLFMTTDRGDLFAKNQVLDVNTVLENPHGNDSNLNLVLSESFSGRGIKDRAPDNTIDWNEKILPQLRDLQSFTNPNLPVIFKGKNRLSIWVALGHVFNKTSDYVLEAEQINQARQQDEHRKEIWRTSAEPGKSSLEVVVEEGSDRAQSICISLSISRDVHAKATAYFKRKRLKYQKWLNFRPIHGAEHNAIPDNGVALATASHIGAEIRSVLNKSNAKKLHIFLACPGVFALFLGRELNACPPIQLYEYEHEQNTYQKSFLL